jgi:hypothetical protein
VFAWLLKQPILVLILVFSFFFTVDDNQTPILFITFFILFLSSVESGLVWESVVTSSGYSSITF